jgi:type IV fimbrial biogenesis protein FimT
MRVGNGFSLVELMITLVIAGIMAAIALPSFREMMVSGRTKGAAENIMAGLRLARTEAIKRNTVVRFQLVSTLDDNCALSTSSMLWVVNQSHTDPANLYYRLPAGFCAAAPFAPPDQVDPCSPAPTNQPAGNPACANDPFIAHKSDGRSSTGITVAADASSIAFGPIGQVLVAGLTTVDITSTDSTGKAWRVIVGAGGSAKLCDPSLVAGSPLSCT